MSDESVSVNDQSANAQDEHARAILIFMPFGDVRLPALGISLLKGALINQGIGCDIRYLNIPFAEQIGLPFYTGLLESAPQFLLGERIFAHALFEDMQGEAAFYFADLQSQLDVDEEHMRDVSPLVKASEGVNAYLEFCISSVPWEQYEVIGFSTTFEQNVASLTLAKRIKELWPDKTIVFGGANCEDEMGLELHRRFPFIDYVCRGEGDDVFPRLVKAILAGAQAPFLPGLVARHDGESVAMGGGALPINDMDSLAYPDFDDYFEQLAGYSLDLTGEIKLPFETSRGCWYGAKRHCTFCGLNDETMSYRSKTPSRVIEEVFYLAERYDILELTSTDNILDLQYLREVMPEFAARNPGWSIFYETKANLRKEQVKLLKRAGVDRLQPGIESLSTDILKLMRKGVTALQNVQLLKWASEMDVDLGWNIITGFPGESPDEYKRMADMIPTLAHLQPPTGIGPVRLDRFSPYFVNPQAFNMVNIRSGSGYRIVYPFPEESLQRLAYYFEYEHADGHDPADYTQAITTAIASWRENYSPGALSSVCDDQQIVIFDRRPIAQQERYVLRGAERAAYLFCDETHPLKAVRKHLAELEYDMDEQAIVSMLDRWIDARLMLRDGDWYISLAVPADDMLASMTGSTVIKQALAGAFMELAEMSRQERLSELAETGQV